MMAMTLPMPKRFSMDVFILKDSTKIRYAGIQND